MIVPDATLTPAKLMPRVVALFEVSASKILDLHHTWNESAGTPVYTVGGRYTSRGWTEWTQGFQFGSALLQYDAADDDEFLEIGTEGTIRHMAPHVSHVGVHDHGFNNVSTYGNILRLIHEGRLERDIWQERYCELALKLSGAVQAARWTALPNDLGFIYSFNGPHSLFIDTMRSLRALALAHRLGHVLMGEQDQRISLISRLVKHAITTARYNIYYGQGRDAYDVRGRTAHESIFNTANGSYRCAGTQQGYSPFSTWTRGLAWAILGYAEQLEFLDSLSEAQVDGVTAGNVAGKKAVVEALLEAARAGADFYLEHSPTDGIPYWDTGAPGLRSLGDYLGKPADPFNAFEPVDSSAASVAAQGLLRLGRYLEGRNPSGSFGAYTQAGLMIAQTLFDEPYLSRDSQHQGLVLHSLYHRPMGWDHIPCASRIPAGEATLWGDYHARELALYIKRLNGDGPYYTFWGPDE